MMILLIEKKQQDDLLNCLDRAPIYACVVASRRQPETTMTATILPTRNEPWGFWGTIDRFENDAAADPAKAWEIASRRIAEATEASPEGVRDFLDSRHGRHFADDVASGLWKGEPLEAAVDAAITRWMGWRIDRRTSRDEGIPRELPYLTGWVTHFQILDEMEA
jgi:hypothetical protein